MAHGEVAEDVEHGRGDIVLCEGHGRDQQHARNVERDVFLPDHEDTHHLMERWCARDAAGTMCTSGTRARMTWSEGAACGVAMAQPVEKRRCSVTLGRTVTIRREHVECLGRLQPNLPIPEEVQTGGYGGLVKFVCAVLEVKCTPLRDAISGRRRVEDVPSPKGGWCNTLTNETEGAIVHLRCVFLTENRAVTLRECSKKGEMRFRTTTGLQLTYDGQLERGTVGL